MDNIQLVYQQQANIPPTQNYVQPISSKQLHMFQYYRMYSIYCQQMINRQYYSQGFRMMQQQQPQQIQSNLTNHIFNDGNVKVQEGYDEERYFEGPGQQSKISDPIDRDERINKRGIMKDHRIKKMKKNIERNTEKNLLVHLKLWLQKFIEQKGRSEPMIKKQFSHIFTKGSNKLSKNQVLQNQKLRPCLQQFFQKRILRYLMNSNIQNKSCIVKYLPILLKKYNQGHCKSLKP